MHPEWKKLEKKSRETGAFDTVSIEDGTPSGDAALAQLRQKYPKTPTKQGGVPTIFAYDAKNRLKYYDGPRTAEDMATFVQGKRSVMRGGQSSYRRTRNHRRSSPHFGIFVERNHGVDVF